MTVGKRFIKILKNVNKQPNELIHFFKECVRVYYKKKYECECERIYFLSTRREQIRFFSERSKYCNKVIIFLYLN